MCVLKIWFVTIIFLKTLSILHSWFYLLKYKHKQAQRNAKGCLVKKEKESISIHLKRIFYKTLLILLDGVRYIKKGTIALGAIVIYPFKKLFSLLFKGLFIPTYRVFLLMRRKIKWSPSKDTLLYPLSTKYVIHVVIILLMIIVTSNNIWARNITGDTIGKESILYSMVGDELEEIVETAEGQIANQTTTIETNGALKSQTETEGTDELEETENITESGALVRINPTESEVTVANSETKEHVVQDGETISQIAANYGITTDTILYINGLYDNAVIKPGQTLKILSYSGVLHTVTSGQTLSSIADKYDVTVEEILEQNKLVDSNDISEGQKLVITNANIPSTTAPKPVTTTTTSSLASTVKNFFTAPTAPVNNSGGWAWPATKRRINQYWNWSHHAVDIDADIGDNIFASQSGTVTAVGWANGYGNRIVIDHGGGNRTLYAHLSAFGVQVGQQVSKGQIIGKAGNTGWSTGPHLHFELILGGTKVNPLSYIK